MTGSAQRTLIQKCITGTHTYRRDTFLDPADDTSLRCIDLVSDHANDIGRQRLVKRWTIVKMNLAGLPGSSQYIYSNKNTHKCKLSIEYILKRRVTVSEWPVGCDW